MLRPIAAASTTAVPSSPLVQFTSVRSIYLHNPFKLNHPTNRILKKPPTLSNLTLTKTRSSSSSSSQLTTHSEKPSDSDWEFPDEVIEEEDGDEDEGSPWEGAILYRRNAAVSHLEYCTTLERLGLGKVSSEFSKNRASEMGLRVVKSVKEFPDGTPVLISADVTRRKQKLRLDGIVRTVISLNCNRCGEPAAQSIYSDFSLLLCEEPLQESDTINLGTIFGDEKLKTVEAEDSDDSLIDLDDQLYFPPEEKVVDISKNIRDLIHVEITITALCGPNCRGLCLDCGTNLNISKCICGKKKVQEKGYGGPLRDLREQMQQT
ncbi:hypothetical protein ACP275_09G103300 [Erythranthe tilingii]